jgi:hypothetical protein
MGEAQPEETSATRPEEASSGWRFVLVVWVASRLFFLLVGAIGAATLTNADPHALREPFAGHMSYWARWDGAWYETIAANGYDETAATAFFPVYPLLIRMGTTLWLSPATAALLISLSSGLVGLYFFHALARDYAWRRAARYATIAFAFFPTAFFFNAAYTESLFLALSTGALWAARIRRNLPLAVGLGYFATITRNFGVFIIVPLAYEVIQYSKGLGWRRLGARVATLMTIPCGLAAYMLYLYLVSNDPLLFSSVQPQISSRTLTLPTETLRAALSTAWDGAHFLLHPLQLFAGTSADASFSFSNTLDLGFLALAAVLLIASFSRLPRDLWLYSLTLILIPLFSASARLPLASFPRYMLAAFPLFFVLGSVLAEARLVLYTWLFASASLGAYLTLLFVSWRWVA